MAERKSTNKYYPPEWTPEQGSLNKFRGRHPLGVRGKKADQGIIVIRFEMPYNVWCGGCGRHIAKGVRFNAEKKCAGSYYSTKIWSFTMKCPTCPQVIEVRTDPEHSDYVMQSGAQRKTEEWEPSAEETGTYKLADDDERKRLAEDPLYRLEKAQDDKRTARERAPQLAELYEVQQATRDDYAANAAIRRQFRGDRKEREKQKEEGKKAGLAVRLLPLTEDDKVEAEVASVRRALAVAPASHKRAPVAAMAGEQACKRRALLDKAAKRGLDLRAFRAPSGVPSPLLGSMR
eukprot:m51a1_g9184 hypothetical protein (290) ;mRNA; f:62968-63972